MKVRTFLTAEWRDLIMLNYEVDPAILRPVVPRGTELDFFNGKTFLSLVGFRFLNTQVFGIPFPFHVNFEEVNLRFYVRRKQDGEWRRGVVFIREVVPRFFIATVARVVYGEPYISAPMRHQIENSGENLQVSYGWKYRGVWHSLEATAHGPSQDIAIGSEAEFITEHYWGYTAHAHSTSEYEVAHPRWRMWNAATYGLSCDVALLYGGQYAPALTAPPASAFIADGSSVTVRGGARLQA